MEERLRRLERWNRILGVCLSLLVVGAIGLAAAPANQRITAQEIILQHPNGGSSITLSASPNVSGVWIGDPKKQHSVAIYQNRESSVLGTYNGQKRCDTALASTQQGPVLQMAGQDRTILLSTKNWQPEAKQGQEVPQEVQFTFVPNETQDR